jgi:uncharacterized protein
MNWLKETPDGVLLNIRVVPRASRNEVQGVLGEALKIRVQAPPVEGKANEAVVDFLAETLGVSPNRVTLVSGGKGRDKQVFVKGIQAAAVLGLVPPSS